MPEVVSKRSDKSGLPPGTLIHVGEPRAEKPRLTAMVYDASRLLEEELETIGEAFPLSEAPAVTWINVDGIHQVEVVEELGQRLGLHPLVLEDILNPEQRPKMEDLGDYLYLVLKMLDWDDAGGEMTVEQVSMLVGANYVISLQEQPGGDVLRPIRDRIREAKGSIREQGPDYLAYALLDGVVDRYFGVLEGLGEKVEDLEEELITSPTPDTLQQLHDLKRKMIYMRKSVWPLREVVAALERSGSSLIGESTGPYLRDVYDHVIQVMDAVETLRDMLSGMLDIYLSSISNRMNEVMKVLTIFASIFIPLTFVAGVYGMNFAYMPELAWRWAYPSLWVVMVAVAVTMLVYFRRKRWL
ncbi:MAG TPA: magnesium/cobalt transporter CorA [Anaerolineae bacterium]|nr:magnesium/cobalt transporter CorA [Anaerolineae bacterium]